VKRKPVTCLSWLSLLLCAAAAAGWARSVGHLDAVSRGTEEGDWELSSLGGRVVFELRTAVGDDPPPPVLAWSSSPLAPGADDGLPRAVWAYEADPAGAGRTVCVLGVAWSTTDQWPNPPHTFSPLAVAVPHGFLCAALGLLPGWRALAWLRRRRRVRSAGRAFEVVRR
jgi:hypothetical protein